MITNPIRFIKLVTFAACGLIAAVASLSIVGMIYEFAKMLQSGQTHFMFAVYGVASILIINLIQVAHSVIGRWIVNNAFRNDPLHLAPNPNHCQPPR